MSCPYVRYLVSTPLPIVATPSKPEDLDEPARACSRTASNLHLVVPCLPPLNLQHLQHLPTSPPPHRPFPWAGKRGCPTSAEIAIRHHTSAALSAATVHAAAAATARLARGVVFTPGGEAQPHAQP